MEDLRLQIENVRVQRRDLELDKAELGLRQGDFNQENADLIELISNRKGTLEMAEAKLRELTLAAYAETGNKKPARGVGIRIVKEVIYDESEAVKWAIAANATNCLSLQKMNFMKVAEGLALPFVEIKEVAQATIAKELA